MQLFSWPGISPKELLSVEPKSVHKMKKKGNIIEIGLIFSVKDFGKFGWKKNYQKNPGWSSDHKCNYLSFSKNTMCLLKCSFKYYKKNGHFFLFILVHLYFYECSCPRIQKHACWVAFFCYTPLWSEWARLFCVCAFFFSPSRPQTEQIVDKTVDQ